MPKRRPFAASPAQRLKVAGKSCLVCGQSPCDPAHLIPRGLLTEGQDEPLAVIALCRADHRAFDEGGLDLLVYWKGFRAELGFAVERLGPRALRCVSNQREDMAA